MAYLSKQDAEKLEILNENKINKIDIRCNNCGKKACETVTKDAIISVVCSRCKTKFTHNGQAYQERMGLVKKDISS